MTDTPVTWLVPDWPAPPGVRAIVTTRDGPDALQSSPFGFNVGIHCGDDAMTVVANRARLREVLALPSEPCWLRQVHGTHVVTITSPPGTLPQSGTADQKYAAVPRADAAVSRVRGAVLAIQTADCLPVLFCSSDGSEVAAVHAGWRGLSDGIIESTLRVMYNNMNEMIVWLGPAIASRSYEVGHEVREAFLAHDPAAESAFSATRPDHWLCDLYQLARQRLRAAGVNRIHGGGLDTFTNPYLHSYRRDGSRSGRMVSLIWLAP